MFSGIDRVDSKLIDRINMAKSTLQIKKQYSGGEFCGKLEEANPRLVRMGTVSFRETPEPFTKTYSQVDS